MTLTEALVTQAAQLPSFRMMVGPLFSETFSACAPNISFLSYGVIGNARRLAQAGRLDVIPSNYSAFCADFAARRHRDLPLKEHEAGAKTADLARKHGISEATIYNWKAKFGGVTSPSWINSTRLVFDSKVGKARRKLHCSE